MPASQIALRSQACDYLPGGAHLPWHRHDAPYIAVILEGEVFETGEYGRKTLGPGAVVFHEPFEAHADTVRGACVRVLNIQYTGALPARSRIARVDDVDELNRLVRTDRQGVLDWLMPRLVPDDCPRDDWPDVLADRINRDASLCFRQWAEEQGIRPETVSRGFRRAYGLTPKQFRANVMARKAFGAIVASGLPLSEIAYTAGYSDQAHMCRAVKALTGRTPGAWLRSSGSNTPAAGRD